MMDDIKRIYSYNPLNSPNSKLNSKYSSYSNKGFKNLKINSPKGSMFTHNKMLSTANMLSLFKDISKKVSVQLNGTQSKGESADCKNKSSGNVSQK